MMLNNNIEIEQEKTKKLSNQNEKTENSETSEEESELETLKQRNIPIYKSLYPPVKESFFFEENNTINNKILRLSQDLPNLRYKKASSLKTINTKKEDDIISKNEEEKEEEEEEDLKMTDKFLEDLIKVPCPISKSKIIAIISNFIKKSKLIEKLENEYQSDKKADLNNLSIVCTEHLSFIELKKGEVLFKIGEIGNKFYIILKGFISILKPKEIYMVKMSYYQYFNYCIQLLKENEIYILEETIKKNVNKIPFDSIETLKKMYKLIFQKKLYENINKQLIANTKFLLNFFDINEQKIEYFDINIEDLQNFELTRNYKEWKHYLINKTKLSKENLDFFGNYDRYVNSRNELYVTCFCLDQFLYLGPGFFFGDSALEKGNIYTGGKRNATIRAETDIILGCLKGIDYADIIEPKRRMEKLKEIGFLFNHFFFQEISIHLFEKNYFHLFSACEYTKGSILFHTGIPARSMIFIKDGRISLELKTSVFNLHQLIQYLYQYIFANPLFMNLSKTTQNKLLNQESIVIIQKYINDPIFKKLRGFSQNFVDELNKNRKYNIAVLAENETIGLQEIFLGIPYLMKGTIVSKKAHSYEITIEHIQKILSCEKQIIIPYIRSSINKILSLIERIQNIKQHYVNSFIQKYEKGLESENINSLNIENLSSTNNMINNNINKNYFLKTENSDNNIKKDLIYNSDLSLSGYNIINKNVVPINNKNPETSKTIAVSDNKSPLKRISYLRANKKSMIQLKKNQKSSIVSNNIQILNYKNQNKTRNYFNNSNKFEYPNIKKNNKIARTTVQFSYFNEINKKKNHLLIGNEYFSLEKLKNKFNEINLHPDQNNEFIQVIQSNKYHTMYNNNDNNTSISTEKNNYENKKEPIFKIKQKFLNYHLSYVPLNNLNNFKETKITDKSFNNDSTEKINSSQTQNPFSSQYSTKDSTKCNTFRKKINSRNYLNINNSNYACNLKAYKSFSSNKETIKSKGSGIFNYKINNMDKKEIEKYKGNIKEKIKDFYRQIKSKGCLSLLNNVENNMFFLRKFNKKYTSTIKRNKSYNINNNKTIENNQSKELPKIKEYNNS